MAENFFGITDTGKVRDNNEDAFIADKLFNGWIVACVIDGVGGYEGGEVAAAIARETILKQVNQFAANTISSLQQALLLANQNIYNEKLGGKGNNQMACVLTVALIDIDNNQFYYAHVGDTRMYLLRDQSLVKVTKDHSFVGFLEDSGRLSEKDAMAHPKRHEINKALGFDLQIDNDEQYIETGSSPFLPGDLLMLCSDGLTDLVDNNTMTSILVSASSLSQSGEALIKAANAAGGKDNITAVLVRNDKKPLKQKATKPAIVKKNEAENQQSVISANNAETQPPITRKKRKGSALTGVLLFLCLLFAGASYWLFTKNKQMEAAMPKPFVQPPLNAAEKKLSDSLGLTERFLTLSQPGFEKNVTLTDTLFIRQDSLHINGNGMVLQKDSAYSGPAFFITANAKNILLENFVFKDFNTAIINQGKGLQLKNVVFQNSLTAIQQLPPIPVNDTVTGTLTNSFINKKDSIPK